MITCTLSFYDFHSSIGNGRNTVSTVLFRERELTEPHWVLGQTRWVLRKTRWVRFGTQIIGWKELTEHAPQNSVNAKKLTGFGIWNRTARNRIRPVSDSRLASCAKMVFDVHRLNLGIYLHRVLPPWGSLHLLYVCTSLSLIDYVCLLDFACRWVKLDRSCLVIHLQDVCAPLG